MAEELYFSIKSNVKGVVQETKEYGDTLQGAQERLKNVNATLKEQQEILVFLQREQIKLQQERAKMSEWERHISGADKKLEDLNIEIKDQRLALKDLTLQQKDSKEAVKEMTAAQKEQATTLVEDIKNYKVFGISLNGIQKGFAKIIPTAKLMFKTITAGILSTGIGALLIAVGSLFTWFNRTKKGAETLQKILAGLGAVVGVLADRFVSFGKALRSLFMLELDDAMTHLKNTVQDLGKELQEEVALTLQLKQAAVDLADAQRKLNVEMAQRRAQIEELKLKADDLNLTEEERIKALNDAADIERNLMSERIANAEEAVRIQTEQMSMSDDLAADLDELAAREIELANIRRESNRMQRTLQRKLNAIQRQAEAKEEARHRAWKKRRDEEVAYQEEITGKINKELNEAALNQTLAMMATEEERQKELELIRFNARLKEIEDMKQGNLTEEELRGKQMMLESEAITVHQQNNRLIRQKARKEREALTNEEARKLLDIEEATAAAKITNERDRLTEELRLQEEAEIRGVMDMENFEEMKLAIQEKYKQIRQEKKDQEALEDKQRARDVAMATASVAAQALQVFQAGFALQSAAIEEDYQNQIKLAKANGQDLESIEKDFVEKRRNQAKKQKALKIGLAIIDTYQSAVAAYAAALQVGGPAGLVLAPISAGLAVAAGLANVAMIEKEPLGGAAPGGGGAAGGMVQQGSPRGDMMGGRFELTGGEEPEPLRAYVVTDEMTDSQNQLANIRRRATI